MYNYIYAVRNKTTGKLIPKNKSTNPFYVKLGFCQKKCDMLNLKNKTHNYEVVEYLLGEVKYNFRWLKGDENND